MTSDVPRLVPPRRLPALGLAILCHLALAILLMRSAETLRPAPAVDLVMMALAPASSRLVTPAPVLPPPKLVAQVIPMPTMPSPSIAQARPVSRSEAARVPTPPSSVPNETSQPTAGAPAPAPLDTAAAVVATADPVPAPNNPSPTYPERARKQGIEGTVMIKVSVDIDGAATGVTIATSSGHDMLDEEALRTVRRWRFRPALLNGRVVAGFVIVPIIFELHA